MRGVKIFGGRSHPALVDLICARLGRQPSKCDLGNFANGETSVQIGDSIRNEDVFIIQSGSPSTNDSVMEMLIMIAACRGGSAKSITAVMPYFPYSRQSKKKSHRGAITAKMLVNMMQVAGIDHVITIDLHASQMQGFFRQGVDNLHSEPLISKWIRSNVTHWQDAVVVSKNVGGSKRVTSLADALKVSFAIVSTDRARFTSNNNNLIPQNMLDSMIFFDAIEPQSVRLHRTRASSSSEDNHVDTDTAESSDSEQRLQSDPRFANEADGQSRVARPRAVKIVSSPLIHTTRMQSESPKPLGRVETAPSARRPSEYEASESMQDGKAREVVTGRLFHGHIVDDDHPSPALSGMSASSAHLSREEAVDHVQDPMTSSIMSTTSSLHNPDHALGGSCDAAASSDEEEERIQNSEVEHTVTLVGNVKGRTVLLMDDLMDRAGSWIAAAETCVKRGGAKRVYCIGIHALFGGDSFEEMEACPYIDHIIVTNSFPITEQRLQQSKKLTVIDISNLLSEAIRRNHHGESMSTLFLND